MTDKFDETLLLVGAGKMGSAMLAGWLEQGLSPGNVYLRDPQPADEIAQLVAERGLKLNFDLDVIGQAAPRVVVLAVKPQLMADVAPEIGALAGPETLFLSVAAGVSLETLGSYLGEGARIVRAMPNTPASIGKGITALIGNKAVGDADRATAETLLRSVGDAVWLTEESDMDAVTALSGSGPAYVFALAECMAAAGEALGLDAALAAKLARSTVAGAGGMLDALDEDTSQLRRNVTSPGGTTAAALDVLLGEDGLASLMRHAMVAARNRSRELGN